MDITDKDLEEYADDIVDAIEDGENIHDAMGYYNRAPEFKGRPLEKLKALVSQKLHAKNIVPFDYNDVEAGDLVDFGHYGKLYVVDPHYSSSYFWATKSEKDRFNPDAQGYSVYKSDAEAILEPASEVADDEEED